jgi:hypothetical protein
MWAVTRGDGGGGNVCGGGGCNKRNDGQCLATDGCQTLQSLIINVVIISKHVNYIIN